MKLLRQAINKAKHFPEFHNLADAFERWRHNEQNIFIEQGQAFAALKKYAEKQHESLPATLEEISTVGGRQLGAENETLTSLSSFQNDLQPLLQQENEISKWRDVCHQMESDAKKSEAAAEKSRISYEKAKASNSNVPKAEADYNAKKRKADDDRKNADSQREKLNEQEAPYKVKFLESYVTPVQAMIDIRIKSAETLKGIAPDYLAAAEKFKEFETNNPSLQKLVDDLEKYNQITVE